MSESVAIVTGASQGIGRATASRLARDFSAIVLVARNPQRLDETATHVKSARRLVNRNSPGTLPVALR